MAHFWSPPPPPPPQTYPNLPDETCFSTIEESDEALRYAREQLIASHVRLEARRRELRKIRKIAASETATATALHKIRKFILYHTNELPQLAENTFVEMHRLRDRLGVMEEEFENEEKQLSWQEWIYTQKEKAFLEYFNGHLNDLAYTAGAQEFGSPAPTYLDPLLAKASYKESKHSDDPPKATRYPSKPSKDIRKEGTERDLEVPGLLGRTKVKAYPDYGSDLNLISKDLVTQNQWKIDRSVQKEFLLPSRATISSVGTVTLPWSFGHESKKYSCTFHVLEKSVHSLMLGCKFLEFTETLSKHVHRVKERIIKILPGRRKRLFFLGHETELTAKRNHIRGVLNNKPMAGLADTGSDLTIIKRSVAEKLGFHILEGEDHKTEVEFVDGSTGFTNGIIRDAYWYFGLTMQHGQCIDVHVMDDLPCDLILDKWFLWDNEAFVEYKDEFVDAKSYDNLLEDHVYLVRKKRKVWQMIKSSVQSLLGRETKQSEGDDMSLVVMSPEELLRNEAFARSKALDGIQAARSSNERETAKRAENDRIVRWRAAHPGCDRLDSNQPPSAHPTAANSSGTNNSLSSDAADPT